METRLKPTPAQTSLFARWKDVKMTTARQAETKCNARVKDGQGQAMNGTPPSPVERLDRAEARLEQRLADIRAERPALSALYASLTAEQKASFSHGDRRHGMMMRRPSGSQGQPMPSP